MWATLVAIFGTLGLWAQIYLTRRAVQSTSEATEAMRESNEIAREAMQKQLRAYVTIEPEGINQAAEDGQARVPVCVENVGETPAHKLMVFSRFALDPNPRDFDPSKIEGADGWLKGDACATLKGQIAVHQNVGDAEMATEMEAVLQDMLSNRPGEVKALRLNWKELANTAGVPQLYSWHRMLSGMSSHVTGASILRGIEFVDGPGPADLSSMNPKLALMMMGGATLGGTQLHAKMIGEENASKVAGDLFSRLARLTEKARGASKDT